MVTNGSSSLFFQTDEPGSTRFQAIKNADIKYKDRCLFTCQQRAIKAFSWTVCLTLSSKWCTLTIEREAGSEFNGLPLSTVTLFKICSVLNSQTVIYLSTAFDQNFTWPKKCSPESEHNQCSQPLVPCSLPFALNTIKPSRPYRCLVIKGTIWGRILPFALFFRQAEDNTIIIELQLEPKGL